MSVIAHLKQLSRINTTDYQDTGTQNHLGAVGGVLDELAARAHTVMLSRLIPHAPEDALTMLGRERGLTRYPGEPLDTFRARVAGAWVYWQQAGTLPGIVAALKQAGYRATVIEHFRDPDREHWAEFSVLVQPLERLETDAWWGGTTWGGGRKWGFVLPAVPLAYLPELVRELKPAHARVRRVLWSPRGRFWGGDVTWGEDRPVPDPPVGWGVQTGYEQYLPADRTDSGPAWGESDLQVLYDMEGNYATETDR